LNIGRNSYHAGDVPSQLVVGVTNPSPSVFGEPNILLFAELLEMTGGDEKDAKKVL